MNQYPAHVKPATRTHCARRGHPFPMPVVSHTDLCLRCHNRFQLNLEALVEAWPSLVGSVMKRPQAGYSEKVSTSGHGDVGGLWNPAAAAAIDELTEWAAFLARTIIREQPVPSPTERVEYIPPRTTATWDEKGHRWDRPLTLPERERAYTRHVETQTYTHGISSTSHPRAQLAAVAQWHARWLSGYPTLGPSLVDDVLDFREKATNAINAVGVRRIEIPNRYCRHIAEETALGPIYCNGHMVGVIRPEDDSRPSEIMCSAHPSHRRIPIAEWILIDH